MTDLINNWIVLLVIIPLTAGILTTFLRGHILLQRIVGMIALISLVGVSLTFLFTLEPDRAMHFSMVGMWPAPFGIAIVFDRVSGILLTIAAFVALGCFTHALYSIDQKLERGWFHPLFHLLIMGINFSFMTGDLFNLFVSFEIMLMASYALLCLAGERRQISQAYKYLTLNLLASTIFVLSAGLVYGMMGTLNYADLARLVEESRVSGEPLPPAFQLVSIMLLFVFACKGAMFPLWFWLPDTYHTLPTAIGGMFAAMLSKVGVYAVLRLFPMIFAVPDVNSDQIIHIILATASGFTMIVAILAACGAMEIRRVLSWVLISHVGYLFFGISVMTPDALSATLFYMSQEMLCMAGLFLCTAMIERIGGSSRLDEVGGLLPRAPWLATLFFILTLGLIGIPPLPGFYAKAMLVRAGFEAGQIVLPILTLVTAALTGLAMFRVWTKIFWSPARGEGLVLPRGAVAGEAPPMRSAYLGVGLLVVCLGIVAIVPQRALDLTIPAGQSLIRPQAYVTSVLGPDAWPSDSATPTIASSEQVALEVETVTKEHTP